jgi:hypothetical protein
MAWPPADPVGRRDDTLARTRRISWAATLTALAATGTLAFAFARALPGHGQVATGNTGSPASPAAPAAGQPAGPAPAQQPAPAPAYTPPQVVSGGS